MPDNRFDKRVRIRADKDSFKEAIIQEIDDPHVPPGKASPTILFMGQAFYGHRAARRLHQSEPEIRRAARDAIRILKEQITDIALDCGLQDELPLLLGFPQFPINSVAPEQGVSPVEESTSDIPDLSEVFEDN